MDKATVMKFLFDAVGIDEKAGLSLSVHPNPANETITVGSQIPIQVGELSVLGIQGTEILRCKITGSETRMDISDFPPGIYWIRLITENSVETGRFVKY